jgi:hypothetical protein
MSKTPYQATGICLPQRLTGPGSVHSGLRASSGVNQGCSWPHCPRPRVALLCFHFRRPYETSSDPSHAHCRVQSLSDSALFFTPAQRFFGFPLQMHTKVVRTSHNKPNIPPPPPTLRGALRAIGKPARQLHTHSTQRTPLRAVSGDDVRVTWKSKRNTGEEHRWTSSQNRHNPKRWTTCEVDVKSRHFPPPPPLATPTTTTHIYTRMCQG